MTGLFFNRKLPELEEEFRQIRKAVLEEYENKVKLRKKELQLKLEENQKKSEEMAQFLEESEINRKSLEQMQKTEKTRLDAFVKRVRPPLVNRDAKNHERALQRIVLSTSSNSSGRCQATLLGADLLVPDSAYLQDVEGEIGNPSAWYYNPKWIKDLKAYWYGKGSGVGWPWEAATGTAPSAPYGFEAIWWFLYIPPVTGDYSIWAHHPYHGFYIIRAHDGDFTSKRAKVFASDNLDVLQYFWRGNQEKKILDINDQHIDEADILDGGNTWWFAQHFGKGDPAYITFRFHIDVYAKGSGSYAEVNFADGIANYLECPLVGIKEI